MSDRTIHIFELDSSDCTRNLINELSQKLTEYGIKFEKLSGISEFSRLKPRVAIVEPFDLTSLETFSINPSHVYSAKFALHLFRNEIPFPRMHFPIYATGLTNFEICITELPKSERVTISQIVKALGGRFASNLTSECTHLIVGRVGSKKYHLATEMNIQIVRKEWIFDSWDFALKSNEIDANINPKDYSVGFFYNLSISVSGIVANEREKIRAQIEANSGKYKPELVFNECNILICGNGESKKTEAARKWKIPCVEVEWINSCISAGKYLDINDFLVNSGEAPSPVMIEPTFLNSKFEKSSKNQNQIENDLKSRLNNSRFLINENSNDTCSNLNYNQNIKNPVFKGLRIFISRNFDEIRAIGLRTMIFHLNGEFLTDLEGATHFISDWNEDLIFKPPGVECINSDWINECYKAQTLIPYDNFIISQNSKNIFDFPSENNIFNIENNTGNRFLNENNLNEYKDSKNEGKVDYNITHGDFFNENDKSLEDLNFNITQKRLKSMKDMQKTISNFAQLNSNKEIKNEPKSVIFERFSNKKTTSILKDVNNFNHNTPVQNFGPSQVIQYDDPSAFKERKKLMSILKDDIEDKENDENNDVTRARQFVSPLKKFGNVPNHALPDNSFSDFKTSDMKFQLSSIPDELKNYYSKIIGNLGAKVSDLEFYDKNCTHLVSGSIIRSEKFLCSVAAGKWVLRESFLKSSELFGAFVNEASHEWGTEENPSEASLSCRKWRLRKLEKVKRVYYRDLAPLKNG